MDQLRTLTIGHIPGTNLAGTRMKDMCLRFQAPTWISLKGKNISALRPELFLLTEDLYPPVVAAVEAGGE